MVDPEAYVDVNIFVYWLGNHPAFGRTSYGWIKRIEQAQRGRYVTSALTLYQTTVIVAGLTGKNLKDRGLVERVMRSLRSLTGLRILPLTVEDLTQATKVMNDYNLDYEDAVHLAAAIRSKAKEIISNDEHFDRTSLKRKFS
ncbi:MAG: type II toxin-antitoxin system VapC family toxin [Candidatus Caldarchaeum sp.]|uniref:PIN domain-containing protein n=1 Tax=Caldiarchaeum subterraneum TaxID=311458 RepID=A0A7C5U5A6_CALS0